MDQRVQPKEDHDILISLWVFMVGTNGDGLLGQFQKFKEETNTNFDSVNKKLAACWTIDDHEKAEKGYVEKGKAKEETRNRRRISGREWVLIAITFAAIVVPHFWK